MKIHFSWGRCYRLCLWLALLAFILPWGLRPRVLRPLSLWNDSVLFAISDKPSLGSTPVQNASSPLGENSSGSGGNLGEKLQEALQKRKKLENSSQNQLAGNAIAQSFMANQVINFLRNNPPMQAVQPPAPSQGQSSSTPPPSSSLQNNTGSNPGTQNNTGTNTANSGNSSGCGDSSDQKMMQLHNSHRADTSVKHVDSTQNFVTLSQPLPPLSVDCKLVQAAHNHSQWMSDNGTLGHCEDKSHPLPPCASGTGPDAQCSKTGGACFGQNAAMASDDPSIPFNLWLEYNQPVGGRAHHMNIDGSYSAFGCSHVGSWWTCNFR